MVLARTEIGPSFSLNSNSVMYPARLSRSSCWRRPTRSQKTTVKTKTSMSSAAEFALRHFHSPVETLPQIVKALDQQDLTSGLVSAASPASAELVGASDFGVVFSYPGSPPRASTRLYAPNVCFRRANSAMSLPLLEMRNVVGPNGDWTELFEELQLRHILLQLALAFASVFLNPCLVPSDQKPHDQDRNIEENGV
jgi:hypothetical protein